MSRKLSFLSVLTTLMDKFHHTPKNLAELSGIKAITIYKLLSGENKNPTLDTLTALCITYRISLAQLMGEEPLENRYIPVIPANEIVAYLKNPNIKSHYKTVTIDIPSTEKFFATIWQDNAIDPFIKRNALFIIDPEKEIHTKDFVAVMEKNDDTIKIREAFLDGKTIYFKTLDPALPIKPERMRDKKYYAFVGVVVQYRTNF
jgi:transcriptional regulator with XRE-family HTH domain